MTNLLAEMLKQPMTRKCFHQSIPPVTMKSFSWLWLPNSVHLLVITL